jgi:hypothetical protein
MVEEAIHVWTREMLLEAFCVCGGGDGPSQLNESNPRGVAFSLDRSGSGRHT